MYELISATDLLQDDDFHLTACKNRAADGAFVCFECGLWCTSQSNFDQHLAGYAHVKRVEWLDEDGAAATAHQSGDDGQAAGADDIVTAASAN